MSAALLLPSSIIPSLVQLFRLDSETHRSHSTLCSAVIPNSENTSIIGANVVRARAEVVATKLGIILSFFFFQYILFSHNGFTYEFEFLHAFLSNKKNKI